LADFAVGDRGDGFSSYSVWDVYYCRKQTFAQCGRTKRSDARGLLSLGWWFLRVHPRDGLDREARPGEGPDDIPFEQAFFMSR